MQPKHMWIIGSIYEVDQVLSNVVGQFLKQRLGLVLCQWPHSYRKEYTKKARRVQKRIILAKFHPFRNSDVKKIARP